MSKSLNDTIINIYDTILSNAPHISSLNIDMESLKKCLRTVEYNKRYKNEELDRAHNSFVGFVLLDASAKNLREAKSYIVYPDFFVNTYITNPEFIHQGQQSLEKSVLIAKREELNMLLPKSALREKLSSQYILIINIERIMIAPNLTHYKLNIKSVPSKMFYTFYNNIILVEASKRRLMEEEIMMFRSRAIHDAIKSDREAKVIDRCEDEFTIIDDGDYEKLKEYLQSKYGITYRDRFKDMNGNEQSVWLNLGLHKFDNRIKTDVNGKREIIPLSLQKTLNKKID